MIHHPTGVLLAALCLPLAACARPGASTRRSATTSSSGGEVAAATAPASPASPPRVDSALVVPRSNPEPMASVSAGGTSGAGGATGDPGAKASAPPAGPVAVVVLMLGNSGDPKELTAAPRTYKLLLTADARTATIEVDDHPIGTAPIQRVYPQRAQPQAATPVARWPPLSVRAAPGAVQALPPRRARSLAPAPQAAESAFPFHPDREPLEAPVHANTLNPNGAPIID